MEPLGRVGDGHKPQNRWKQNVPEEMPRNLVPKQREAAKGYAKKYTPRTAKSGASTPGENVAAEAEKEPRHTVTASNAQLLASMLEIEAGEPEPASSRPGSGRSTRMRREVRSARDIETERALDNHVERFSARHFTASSRSYATHSM